MKKVLFISTAAPPRAESQTIRNVFFIRALVAHGFQVELLTKKDAGGDESLVSLLPDGVEILRTKEPLFSSLVHSLVSIPCGKFIQHCVGVLSNLFIVPDLDVGWDKVAVEYYLGQLDTRPDVIVSASGSYTAHMAARELSDELAVPFVAELGDPWSHNPIWPANLYWRRKLNERLELSSVPAASALVVTTDGTKAHYEKWIQHQNINVIPMGYSPDEFDLSEGHCPNKESFDFTYVGVAYKGGRNILPFLEGVADLSSSSIGVRIVGPHSTGFVKHANRNDWSFVSFSDPVTYKESVRILQASNVLVIVGNSGYMQIPGKVYMYLAAQKPILFISQNPAEKDPTWQLLSEFEGTYFCRNDRHSVAQAVSSIRDDVSSGSIQINRKLEGRIQRYDWSYLGETFANVVTRVTSDEH